MKQFVYAEIYQYYGLYPNRKSRRIARLPDVDDELVEMLKIKYPKPRFWVRLVTEMF